MKEILEKVKKTIELLGAPVSAIALVWGKDISFYTTATVSVLIAIISYVEVFFKEEKKKTTSKKKK